MTSKDLQREIEFQPGRHFVARFLPGQDLHEAITEFCRKHKIKAGYIPSVFGGLKWADVINPDPNKEGEEVEPVVKRYDHVMEFLGQGTIALNQKGEYENHLHIVGGGDSHNLVCMGHLVKGEMAILTEIVIIETKNIEMIREVDPGVFPKPLLFFRKRVG